MKKLILTLPAKYNDLGLLLLRLVLGLSMMFGHGLGKWERLFGAEEIKFADPFGLGPVASLGLAVFAEVICSILVSIGLFTRLSTIPLMITMATAYFTVHFDDPFGRQEKVVIYGIAFLALFLMGPGKYSVDNYLSNKR